MRELIAFLNSGILIVYSIGFTKEFAKKSVSQTLRRRKRASTENERDSLISRKVNNTYGSHTDNETSVTMNSVMVSFRSVLR